MLNKLGDKIAGHKNLKKILALIKLSAMSSLPSCCNFSRNVAKHSLNCGGKCLWLSFTVAHAPFTAFLKACCCLDKDPFAFSGSTSQSLSEEIISEIGADSVSCKYCSPVSFKKASILFVAREFPRNVRRWSPTRSKSKATTSVRNSAAIPWACINNTRACPMSSLAFTPIIGSRNSQTFLKFSRRYA